MVHFGILFLYDTVDEIFKSIDTSLVLHQLGASVGFDSAISKAEPNTTEHVLLSIIRKKKKNACRRDLSGIFL